MVIPLLNDIVLLPDAKGLQTLFVAFQLGSFAAEGSNTDSGGLMRDETKDQSDRLRSHKDSFEPVLPERQQSWVIEAAETSSWIGVCSVTVELLGSGSLNGRVN